jgi:hypothetical protein
LSTLERRLERAPDGPPSRLLTRPKTPEPTPPATDFHSACYQSQMSSPPTGVQGLNQSSASSRPPSLEAERLDVPSSLRLILAGHAASVEFPTALASAGRVLIADRLRSPLRVYTRRARRSAGGSPKSRPTPSPSSATQAMPLRQSSSGGYPRVLVGVCFACHTSPSGGSRHCPQEPPRGTAEG